MDFEAYETFLENLSSIIRGIDYLIQKAESKSGKRFVWSPVAPDVVTEGTLDYVGWGFIYIDSEDILQVILEHLNYENFIIELVYTTLTTEVFIFFLLDINEYLFLYRVGRAYFTTRFNIMVYHIEYTYKDYNANQMRKNVQFFGSRNELSAFIQYINSKTDVNIINVWGF